MKNTKRCIKCESQKVIRIPGGVDSYGSRNNIRAGIFILNAVEVSIYLCCECGYSEEWVDDKKDIEKLIKYYKA